MAPVVAKIRRLRPGPPPRPAPAYGATRILEWAARIFVLLVIVE
jgi:hypothetical protein